MSDILKIIKDGREPDKDPRGYLSELENWTEDDGRQLAAEEGISMTAKHWEVVRFLREQYRQHGPARYAREVVQLLESRYAHEGGRRFLYRLFPRGPVRQASRIAGLPVPAHATDPSFGSVQ